ncbi:MAG TPA: CRISPR-associated endonuclease Cas3'' [Ilumatobacteraceae bacterium]|nr:CRISPR-associated endonuclease Cas3'' [Ilumatobacteraceae bacterium]
MSIQLGDEQVRWLDALWGKSDVNGSVHLLVQHLLDTLAVAEVMWDRFLAPCVRQRLDEIAGGGEGRAFFSWVAGLHDIGKATPIFQVQAESLRSRVQTAGLDLTGLRPNEKRIDWRHEVAGAAALVEELTTAWGPETAVEWVWPLVAGHHGLFPDGGRLALRREQARQRMNGSNDVAWVGARQVLIHLVTAAAGFQHVTDGQPQQAPSRAEQLAIAGLIVMADWIASGPFLSGTSRLDDCGLMHARRRAERAWDALGLRGGWDRRLDVPDDIYRARFDRSARHVQALAVDVARAMPGPGLMVVEAPMGEGKTELALAVAEVFASRFGQSGVAVAMPTQATCDPIYLRSSGSNNSASSPRWRCCTVSG